MAQRKRNPNFQPLGTYNEPEENTEDVVLSNDNLYSVTIKDKRFGQRKLTFDFTDVPVERLIGYAVAHLRIRYKQSIVDDEVTEWPAVLDEVIRVADIPSGRVRLTGQQKLVRDIQKLGLSQEELVRMLGIDISLLGK